ncbi:MAG: thioesterase family protein [bacterium]
MKIFKTRTRVRYAETDATAIVYYGNYFVYFELGRIEMFRELGLPYDWRLPIVETHCRYHASAAFDDPLEIHTFLEELRARGFKLGCRVYRVRDDDPEPLLLVEGYSSMVTVGEERTPIPLPEDFRRAFDQLG